MDLASFVVAYAFAFSQSVTNKKAWFFAIFDQLLFSTFKYIILTEIKPSFCANKTVSFSYPNEISYGILN